MSFNLSTLQSLLTTTATNLSNMQKKIYEMFYDPQPKNVSMDYIDPNTGNTTTITMPNKSKMFEDLKSTYTFYVDATNGNDNNTGSSPTQAFATIRRAIHSIPHGGIGEIRLTNELHIIESDIYLMNRTVHLKPINGYALKDANNPWITFAKHTNNNYNYSFMSSFGGTLNFISINLRTADVAGFLDAFNKGAVKREDFTHISMNFIQSIIEIWNTPVLWLPIGPKGLSTISLHECTIDRKSTDTHSKLIYAEGTSLFALQENNTTFNGTAIWPDVVSYTSVTSSSGFKNVLTNIATL